MRTLQVGLTLVAVYVAMVALAWLLQRRLIYLPMGNVVPPAPRSVAGAEDVRLLSDDGLDLGAWFVPAHHPESVGTVIFCNGNAGNRSDRANFASAMASRGISVLLFDYRGYGGNPGHPTEAGLVADLRAAIHYVVRDRATPLTKVVLVGESLGAAVVLAVAIEAPPAGVILRSPFLSMTAVGRLHYPFLPVAWLLRDRYPSSERIPQLRCPLLILAGDKDRIVPPEQSRALYEAAGSENKRFVLVGGADHNSGAFLDGIEMLGEVTGFVRRVVASN